MRPVVEIFRAQRSSLVGAENQVFRFLISANGSMAFEGLAQGRAHRDHSLAASRLWGPKPLRVGIGLKNLNTPTQEIKTLPAKCENLPDPQTGEECCQYDRAARFWQP